ncbi:hypothetical protein L0F63_000907 [Massospora cicadina]|nr:hypothetical protein L0F63_000907 [Massospora cicadina]
MATKKLLGAIRGLRNPSLTRQGYSAKLKPPLSLTTRTFFVAPPLNLIIISPKATKKDKGPPKCTGCGSTLQHKAPKLPGYIPTGEPSPEVTKLPKKGKGLSNDEITRLLCDLHPDLLKQMYRENSPSFTESSSLPTPFTPRDVKEMRRSKICQRCFNLRYHQMISTDWRENSKLDASKLAFLQEQPSSVIIYVVDAFDLSGSLLTCIREALIGEKASRRVVLVLNKCDLLPRGLTGAFLNRFIGDRLHEAGLHDVVLKHFFVSAKSGQGLSELVDFLRELGDGESDFYFIGCTNVGKSELINTLVRMATEKGHSDRAELAITTSVVPGTTMDLLVHYLTFKELKLTFPTRAFRPKTYRWEPERVLFLGGLARFDYAKGTKRVYVTVYSILPVHITNLRKASVLTDKLNEMSPTILYPPILSENRATTAEIPPLVPIENNPLEFLPPLVVNRVAADICIDGIGWISLIIANDELEPIEIMAFTRGGHGISYRKPLCPVLDKFVISKVENIPPPPEGN